MLEIWKPPKNIGWTPLHASVSNCHLTAWLIWLLQVKEELISSPRSLNFLTDSRWMLFKWYWKLCLKDLAIVRTLHLVPLKKSFQISLQRVKIFKSLWRSTQSCIDLISLPILASSAYRVLKDRFEILSAMSFTYNININGPSIDPWGTPDLTVV